MTRTFTAVPGAASITIVQRQALKTSDGLYFYDSDSNLIYVKVSNDALLLLNNIYSVPEETRSYTMAAESRTYEV